MSRRLPNRFLLAGSILAPQLTRCIRRALLVTLCCLKWLTSLAKCMARHLSTLALGYFLINVFTTVTNLPCETVRMLLTVPQVLRTLLKLNPVANPSLGLVPASPLMSNVLPPPTGQLLRPDRMKHAVTPCNVLRVRLLPPNVRHCRVGLVTVPKLLYRCPHLVHTYLATVPTPLMLSTVARRLGTLSLVLAVRRVIPRTSELKSAVMSFTCGLEKWPLNT